MTGPIVPIVDRVVAGGERTAVVDPRGTSTFVELDTAARALAATLRNGDGDLADARVAVLAEAGRDFDVATLGCWHAGAVVVPLHPPHPLAELDYVIGDADVSAIVASPRHLHTARQLAGGAGLRVIDVGTEDGGADIAVAPVPATPSRPAVMVHTSGTTGRPKGVVHTHGSIAAQVDALLEAWAWSDRDRILLVLPLNHVHGLVNVTLCALAAGACCEAPGGFDAEATWSRLASGDLTLFMAVPTIYGRLIAAWSEADEALQRRWSAGAGRLRLMVSGSAALPVSTLERWQEITGHVLLERYGMTELGMALSNSLARRVPGHVGEPLPAVEVRIVDDAGADVAEGTPGELLVRGPNVFRQYWRRPDATAEAFTDGWFRTGDVAVHEPEGYRMLGRSSVDIIKSGGEKVSALEIEEVFRTHAGIADCAVVGIEDPEWGERVCIAIVPAVGATDDGDALRAWGKHRLAPAKVPTRYAFVDELPRNTLGKTIKPEVKKLF
jgi:malonyl-CoA/methylmalonyl-CoA synthetase